MIEQIGKLWGDQTEYLICEACETRWPWDDDSPERCPVCEGEISVHVPHSQGLLVRYLCWKSDQTWMPQRYYVMGDEGDYRYWAWLGREWHVRSWEGLAA